MAGIKFYYVQSADRSRPNFFMGEEGHSIDESRHFSHVTATYSLGVKLK